MTYEDVLSLTKAGFNAQQIGAFAKMAQQPVQNTGQLQQPVLQTPQLQQQVLQTPQFAQLQQPIQGQTIANDNTDMVLKAITDLQTTMQISAIQNSQQPTVMTTDDVIANIINPKAKEGGNNA